MHTGRYTFSSPRAYNTSTTFTALLCFTYWLVANPQSRVCSTRRMFNVILQEEEYRQREEWSQQTQEKQSVWLINSSIVEVKSLRVVGKQLKALTYLHQSQWIHLKSRWHPLILIACMKRKLFFFWLCRNIVHFKNWTKNTKNAH